MVKLLVAEPDSEDASSRVLAAEALATSVITIAKVGSAVGRKEREGGLSPAQADEALDRFARILPGIALSSVDRQLTEHAGRLAREYGLRGYDAMHLASALRLANVIPRVQFLTADQTLRAAAAVAGLMV